MVQDLCQCHTVHCTKHVSFVYKFTYLSSRIFVTFWEPAKLWEHPTTRDNLFPFIGNSRNMLQWIWRDISPSYSFTASCFSTQKGSCFCHSTSCFLKFTSEHYGEIKFKLICRNRNTAATEKEISRVTCFERDNGTSPGICVHFSASVYINQTRKESSDSGNHLFIILFCLFKFLYGIII